MALDFPSTPSVDDVYTSGGLSWKWNGESWVSVAASVDGLLKTNNLSDLASASTARTNLDVYDKGTVDGLIYGLSWKQAVRAATTANGTLASAFENGDTIDGVTLATGDRILIKNQSSAAENGIYLVNASGAPTRAPDANSAAELVNASVYISEGSTLADTQWTCTTNAPITVGTTALAFAQLSSGSGAPSLPTNAQSGTSYTVLSTDNGQALRFTNAANVVVSLPQATGSFGAGFFFYVEFVGAAGGYLSPTTSTIQGLSQFQMYQGGAALVRSDGTNWLVTPMAAFYGGTNNTGYSLNFPNSAASGGNVRGQYAVDLQLSRSNAANVASGVGSFTVGVNNKASNLYTAAIGNLNVVSGSQGFAVGDSNTVTCTDVGMAFGRSNTVGGTNGCICGGNYNVVGGYFSVTFGDFCNNTGVYSFVAGHGAANTNRATMVYSAFDIGSDPGSAQTRVAGVLCVATSGATAVRLTSDGAAATASTIQAPQTGGILAFTAEMVILDRTNGKSVTYTWDLCTCHKPSNAASTVMGTGNPAAVAGPTTGGGFTLAAAPTITADTTLGGLDVSFTPPTGNTASLRAVFTLRGTETR